MGIGTAAPTELLEVRKDQNTATLALVTNSNSAAGTSAGFQLAVDSGTAVGGLRLFGPSDASRPDTMLFFSGGGVSGGLKFESDAGPIVLETSFTEAMRIDTSQNVGIGTTSPQGRIHTYDTIGGSLVWIYDGLDGTSRTVIPNGTGDVLYRTIVEYIIRSSAGTKVAASTQIDPGGSVGITVGTDTVTIAVAADGSVTTSRTAGTNTHKVVYRLLWL